MILAGLRHPIVLAPLAGGPGTPALCAAVAEAGGLGSLPAGYRTVDGLRDDLAEVRRRSGAPFAVNLFVPGGAPVDRDAVDRYVERLRREHGDAVGEPRDDDDGWAGKLALLVTDPVAVVSFVFGLPPPEAVTALHDAGSEVWVTVTDPEEARRARAAGADALVVQGVEAGGHRGGFADRDDAERFGLLALLRLVSRDGDGPAVAAGGIGDGAGVAAVLAAGAAAAQVGTAFLRADEAGTNPAHATALASDSPTALTRAFTGRTARGIANRFMAEHGDAPAAYPHLHNATAPIRADARRRGDAGGFNLWAGQAHALAEAAPAAEIVRSLADGARRALADAAARAR